MAEKLHNYVIKLVLHKPKIRDLKRRSNEREVKCKISRSSEVKCVYSEVKKHDNVRKLKYGLFVKGLLTRVHNFIEVNHRLLL